MRGYYLLIKNWLFWKKVLILRLLQRKQFSLSDWEAYETAGEEEQ